MNDFRSSFLVIQIHFGYRWCKTTVIRIDMFICCILYQLLDSFKAYISGMWKYMEWLKPKG